MTFHLQNVPYALGLPAIPFFFFPPPFNPSSNHVEWILLFHLVDEKTEARNSECILPECITIK